MDRATAPSIGPVSTATLLSSEADQIPRCAKLYGLLEDVLMFADSLPFDWTRPKGGEGFVWEPTQEGRLDGPGLALRVKPGAQFVSYSPLEEPVALYRELAGIDLTPDGTLVFANRYGHLGGAAEDLELKADIFGRWVSTVGWLREAVRIWDLYQAEDIDALGELFRWTGDRVDYVFSSPLLDSLGGDHRGRTEEKAAQLRAENKQYLQGYDILGTERGLNPSLRVRQGDLLRPAIVFVLGQVNQYLPRHNGPLLKWNPTQHKIAYQDTPFNLFGAVWLQFAQAIHSGKKGRRCQRCGLWFEVSSGSSRTDKLFCSNSCRTRNYQERRERALRLHAVGKTAQQIAKELGSETKTVRGWLRRG
jgi:hypothetical protein